jgi:hypothetical protein
MEIRTYSEHEAQKDIAALGLKKSLISLKLNKSKLKKSGKGQKGNTFFHRDDYIGLLLEGMAEYKCFSIFSLGVDGLAVYEFIDGETGAKIISVMPWKPVNVVFTLKQTGEVKKVLDDMQEIGAGGSYALRYLETWFFSLAEDDVVDMAPKKMKVEPEPPAIELPGFIYNKKGEKLPNPEVLCAEANKIKMMFGAAITSIDGLKYDEEKLIKSCLGKLKKAGFIESDSKKEFPVEYMGALIRVIKTTKEKFEKEFLQKKVKEKFDGINGVKEGQDNRSEVPEEKLETT